MGGTVSAVCRAGVVLAVFLIPNMLSADDNAEAEDRVVVLAPAQMEAVVTHLRLLLTLPPTLSYRNESTPSSILFEIQSKSMPLRHPLAAVNKGRFDSKSIDLVY